MSADFGLRRKLTFKAHGRQVVFVKKPGERLEHVLMKAFLWALYLPDYPDLSVEVGVGDRYKPDVVMLGADGRPLYWGEAGKVSAEKVAALTRRYRDTHFALAKWGAALRPFVQLVERALPQAPRTAPFDLLSFPTDSADRFVDARGHLHLTLDDLTWTRLG